jgi:hypothetical protein
MDAAPDAGIGAQYPSYDEDEGEHYCFGYGSHVQLYSLRLDLETIITCS